MEADVRCDPTDFQSVHHIDFRPGPRKSRSARWTLFHHQDFRAPEINLKFLGRQLLEVQRGRLTSSTCPASAASWPDRRPSPQLLLSRRSALNPRDPPACFLQPFGVPRGHCVAATRGHQEVLRYRCKKVLTSTSARHASDTRRFPTTFLTFGTKVGVGRGSLKIASFRHKVAHRAPSLGSKSGRIFGRQILELPDLCGRDPIRGVGSVVPFPLARRLRDIPLSRQGEGPRTTDRR